MPNPEALDRYLLSRKPGTPTPTHFFPISLKTLSFTSAIFRTS